MAEENHDNDTEFLGLDDMSAMRVVLRTVKGISPISLAPVIEEVLPDERQYAEQYQFE